MDYKHRVYYQILNYAFFDSNGDGIGDFKGIASKLNYLKDLGVGGIWLSPIHQSDSYHSYDVIDYRSEKSDYVVDGYGIDDLINDANNYDIAIMLDMVFNHSSLNHKWFQGAVAYALGLSTDSSYKDFYVFSKTKVEDKGWYEYTMQGKSLWYYGSFSPTMPDLNYSATFDYDNDPVFKAVVEEFKFWIDKGVYAFRLDGIRHFYELEQKVEDVPSNQKFLSALCGKIKEYNKDVFILGEAFIKDERIGPFAVGVDSLINFPVANQLKNLFCTSGDIINYAKQMQIECRKYQEDFVLTNMISSHDEGTGRFSVNVSSDINKMYIGAMLNIMLPGIPFIYYGDEVGLLAIREYTDPKFKEEFIDAINRTPMPWDKNEMQAHYILDTVRSKDNEIILSRCDTVGTVYDKPICDVLKDKSSLYYYYRSLIVVRNMYPDLFYKGSVQDYYTAWTQSKVLYYDVIYKDEVLGVVINISDSENEYNINKPFKILHSLAKDSSMSKESDTKLNMPPVSLTIIKY
ncbi:MAG: hypothetical protein IJW28_05350 [Clostridia bacterium]|nr:hypothetical protein [Clostridia bacterium]